MRSRAWWLSSVARWHPLLPAPQCEWMEAWCAPAFRANAKRANNRNRRDGRQSHSCAVLRFELALGSVYRGSSNSTVSGGFIRNSASKFSLKPIDELPFFSQFRLHPFGYPFANLGRPQLRKKSSILLTRESGSIASRLVRSRCYTFFSVSNQNTITFFHRS
jgi:hypothetical protein